MRADDRELVIVGASLAGLRAAEALRAEGFAGTLTIVGDEPHLPYDRPPLSKQVLASADRPAAPELPLPKALGARWHLGRAAVGLDPERRTVVLADGTLLPYDGLLVATGSAARSWPADRPAPPRAYSPSGPGTTPWPCGTGSYRGSGSSSSARASSAARSRTPRGPADST